MLRKILFILLPVLLTGAVAQADVIRLKNGKTVTGEIYEETPYSVRVKVRGIPQTIYRYEIETIRQDGEKKKTPDPAAAEPLSEAKEELIRRLLEANGAKQAIQDIFIKVAAQAPESRQEELKAALKSDALIDRLIPVYHQIYNIRELKELVMFYNSALGQKQIKVAPQLMESSLQVTVDYFRDILKGDGGTP